MNNTRWKVLLVEDDEDDYILTRELLSEARQGQFEMQWISTFNEASQALATTHWDAILVDYRLGEHDGLDLVREVTRQERRSPVIVLTGQGDRDVDIAAMEAGAADYLVKGDLNAPLLERTIRYAIERQRAEDNLRQNEAQFRLTAARATALARIAARLNAQLDLDTVLQTVCEETARALDIPAVAVALYDDRQGVFFYAAARGLLDDFTERAQPEPLTQYEQYLSRSSLPSIHLNTETLSSELPNSELYVALDIQCLATAMLVRNKWYIGSLTGYIREPQRTFTEEELFLLQAVADQAVQAIANARLFEQAQGRLKQLRALHTVVRAITASLDLSTTLDVILAQVVAQLHVDAASVLLFDREKSLLEYAAGRGFRKEKTARTPIPLGAAYAGRAAAERRTLHVARLTTAEGNDHPYLAPGEAFISYHAVPLIAQDEIKGVLDIYHRTPFEPDSEWLEFLDSLADQVAIAIANADLFTETRRLLQQTQEQARQVQHIINTVPEGMLLLNAVKRIVLANPAAQAYLDELAGKRIGQILTHLAGQPLSGLLEMPQDDRSHWHELTIEETRHTFEVTARPVQTQTQVDGWVLVLRDVTQERARRQHLQAQERLATVGQLAAGIAHDFNNIMGVIALYSGTLEYSPDMPKRQQYLATITQQAKHAANLIGQILDFSRRSVMERRRLNLLLLVKEMVKMLERTLPEDITIELTVDSGEHFVHADPTRIQQVLMNLAVNARDAMPDGGRLHMTLSQLTLHSHEASPLPEMAPGTWVQLDIIDNGSGIPSDTLPHIFEPFFTTKPAGAGTGLGLAQVYGIVKQHDGEIGVVSRPGETTFTICLPALPTAIKETRPVADELVPRAGAHEVVLVVEDNEVTRTAIQNSLDSLGYHVLGAANGQEALALFDRDGESINLVLSDMVMPEMGGLKLYEQLQLQQKRAKLIIMTGYPLEDEGKLLLEQGIVAWIQKPFTADELARKVRRVLDGS